MGYWIQITCCPYCGGKVLVSIHFGVTHDFAITKAGVLSRRYTVSPPGPLDCITAHCQDCGKTWDSNQMVVDQDNTVWVRAQT